MIKPIILSAHGVTLAPLAPAHAEGLAAASADGDLWRLYYANVPEPATEATAAYIRGALDGQAAGRMLPFAVLDDAGRVLGSTRLYDIDETVPNCAIGYTFHAASVQRTHVNSACKRLLLGHAFETLGMQAVYFHTSHLNLRSQAAIERLGARFDGVLRNHRRHQDGSLRNTFSYSIIAEEWPAIRERLDARLAAG